MLKPVAAGLMCLGLVTLGVAISRGQDAETELVQEVETDLIVIDGKLDATEVKTGENKQQPPAGVSFTGGGGAAAIGISSGGEAGVSVDGRRFKVVSDEKGGIFVYSDDGKLIERHDAGATPGKVSARFTRVAQAQHMVDPQTRESLERMTAELKEQIQKLQSEGKQDEAQQKARSLGAIEALLNGNPRVINIMRRSPAPQQAMEEIKKLHDRLQAMVQESSKLPERPAAERDKINQEVAKIQKEIAEKYQALAVPNPFGGQPGQTGFVVGQPMAPGMLPHFHGGGIGFPAPQQHGMGHSAGMVLMRKSEALSQAAAQLKSNGLDEQAQPLQAQAEKLRAEGQKMIQEEAAKRRAEGAAQGGFGGGGGGGGFGGFPGGPPMDLHRSIHELQEQIQQLRKEVGELRELLQRKQ